MEVAISSALILLLVVLLLGMRSGTGTAHGASDVVGGAAEVNVWALMAFAIRGTALVFFVVGVLTISRGEAGLATALAMLAALPLLAPSILIDRALTPLGLPATIFWFSRFMGEPLAGALISAARALGGAGKRRAERIAWLELEAAYLLPPRSGWDVVVRAELWHATGNGAGARLLFEGLSRLERGWRNNRAWRHAHRWLLADAASRGDWARVRRQALQAPPLHEARLVAASIAPQRRPLALLLRWIFTPSHSATWRWLRHGMRPPGVSAPVRTLGSGEPALEKALRIHADLRSHRITWHSLREAADAWQAIDSPALRAETGRRIAALGGRRGPAEAMEAVLVAAEADLAALVEAIAEPLRDEPPLPQILEAARERVVADEYERLCDATTELNRVARARWTTRSSDAWTAWSAWRRSWDGLELVTTHGELSSMLALQQGPACNFAAEACNRLGERFLANQVFRFLVRECQRLHVLDDMELLRNNERLTR